MDADELAQQDQLNSQLARSIAPIQRRNLITGGMTAEIAVNASNLLSDIKPGYMLGAKPRQQAIGHCIGIVSGAIAATPLYFLLFLPPDDTGIRSTATILSDQFRCRTRCNGRGVAELIAPWGEQPSLFCRHLHRRGCDCRSIHRNHDYRSEETVPPFISSQSGSV
jgi:hypothetical protein